MGRGLPQINIIIAVQDNVETRNPVQCDLLLHNFYSLS